MKFTITRDSNADAGYMITCVSFKLSNGLVKDVILIYNINSNSPASIAGMNREYIGYELIAVNDVFASSCDELKKLLDSTKKPNNTFTIDLRHISAKNV